MPPKKCPKECEGYDYNANKVDVNVHVGQEHGITVGNQNEELQIEDWLNDFKIAQALQASLDNVLQGSTQDQDISAEGTLDK